MNTTTRKYLAICSTILFEIASFIVVLLYIPYAILIFMCLAFGALHLLCGWLAERAHEPITRFNARSGIILREINKAKKMSRM